MMIKMFATVTIWVVLSFIHQAICKKLFNADSRLKKGRSSKVKAISTHLAVNPNSSQQQAYFEESSKCELILLEGSKQVKPITHKRNFSDDVLYVGGLALIEGEPPAQYQIMHFFDDDMVRLSLVGAKNELRTVHVDTVRPILTIRE
jgi:hypothetical protein